MLWLPRALSLLLLSLWFWPPTAAALTVAAAIYCPLAVPFALLPTLILLSAICSGPRLPAWAWVFATPDAPESPYGQYEPQAARYYVWGRVAGDYLWFAWRNQLNGLSLHWGASPNYDTDKFTFSGVPGSHSLSIHIWRSGKPYAWCIRDEIKVGSRVVRYQFGWKFLDDFYLKSAAQRAAQQITPPAMVALQIELRRP